MIAEIKHIERYGPNIVLTWDETKVLDYVRGAVYKSQKHADRVFLAFRATMAHTLAADYAVMPIDCDLKNDVLNVEPLWIQDEGLECIGYLDFVRLRVRIAGFNA